VIVELPAINPKRSMICSTKSYSWMEQEIIEDFPKIEVSRFKETLEVIEEMSMDKDEMEEHIKVRVIAFDSVLEAQNQETETSSHHKNRMLSSIFSSTVQVAGKFEEEFSKMVDAIYQEQKFEFQGQNSEPIDIFSEELVHSEFVTELEIIESKKEQFIFEIP
jgi:hypothetical protein